MQKLVGSEKQTFSAVHCSFDMKIPTSSCEAVQESLECHQVRHHQIERGQYHSKPAKRDSGDKSDNDHKLTAKATAALGRLNGRH